MRNGQRGQHGGKRVPGDGMEGNEPLIPARGLPTAHGQEEVISHSC